MKFLRSVVDNFRPYIQKVELLSSELNSFYTKEWYLNGTTTQLNTDGIENPDCNKGLWAKPVIVNVTASEYLSSLTLQISNTEWTATSTNNINFNFEIPIEVVKLFATNDNIILTFTGTDLAGNSLENFSDNNPKNIASRNEATGAWNNANPGNDICHSFTIFEIMGGSNKNFCTDVLISDFMYETNGIIFTFSDLSVTTGQENITYLWDFGDGNTSTEANPEHTYWASGEYDVTLTINSDLYNSSETKPVEVIANTTTDLIVPSANFPTIQSAIDFVETNGLENATVHVQPGTYTENINFLGLTNFSLIGDPTNPETTIIDGGGSGTVVTFSSGEDLTTLLSGFTIQNGESAAGGGVICENSSPKLDNLIISNNTFVGGSNNRGAGFYANNSNFELSNSTIENNGILLASCSGGGVYLNNSSGKITNVIISNNTAEYGGGMSIHGSNCEINNLTVQNNTATYGGGIFTTSSMINNTDLFILNNSASSGCGIFASSSTANNFKNIVLSENFYTGKYISPAIQFDGGVGIANIENVTMVNNKVGLYSLSDQINVRNCIITDNINFDISAYNPVFVEYSNIGSKLEYPNNITWGEGNINTDPEFNNTTSKSDDYYLQPSSLCINTGNPEEDFNDSDETRNDMGACRNNITEYIVGDTTMCQNSQKTYSIEASPNHQYTWNIPATWEIVSGEGTNTIEVITGEVSGDVFVTVTGNNQVVESLHIPTEVDLLPFAASAIDGEIEPCINSKVKYSVSPILNANEYIWAYPSSWNNVTIDENNLIVKFANISGGVVSVKGNNECGDGEISSIKVYPGYPIQGPEFVPIGIRSVQYSVVFPSTTVDNFNWTIPEGWRIIYGQGTKEISVRPNSNSGFVDVDILSSFTKNNFCPLWVEMVDSKETLLIAENEGELLDMQIFPNPSNGVVNIEVNSQKEIFGEISIYNCTGQKIKTLYPENKIELNTEMQFNLNLDAGIYFIKLSGEKNIVRKLIITD